MKNVTNMPKVALHLHIEGTLTQANVLKKVEEKNLDFDKDYINKLSKPLSFTSLPVF